MPTDRDPYRCCVSIKPAGEPVRQCANKAGHGPGLFFCARHNPGGQTQRRAVALRTCQAPLLPEVNQCDSMDTPARRRLINR